MNSGAHVYAYKIREDKICHRRETLFITSTWQSRATILVINEVLTLYFIYSFF